MHQISTDILLCESIQILNNFNASHAEDIVKPCYDITKVGLKDK